MLWFNFILGLIFLFFCFKLIIRHYHTQKQKKIKIKPKIKLNHNIDIKVVLQFTTCCLHVWLAAVFITHLRNTRLSIVWVQLTLCIIEILPHFRPTCYRFSYRHDRLVSPNPNILCVTYRKRKWRLRRNCKELFSLSHLCCVKWNAII